MKEIFALMIVYGLALLGLAVLVISVKLIVGALGITEQWPIVATLAIVAYYFKK